MIWKTTLTNIFLPAENVKKEFHALPTLENSGKNVLAKMTFLLLFFLFAPLVATAQSQGNNGNGVNSIISGDDCITFDSCPEDQVVCATDIVEGVLGAYVDWTTPQASQTCVTDGREGNFQMLFELNEQLLTVDCWDFNWISRIGQDNGKIRLFSGSDDDRSNQSEVITPFLYIKAGSETSFDINYHSGDYYIDLELVSPDGTIIQDALAPIKVDGSTTTYTFFTPNTKAGPYRLKYIFTYDTTSGIPKNANTGDTLISVDGILNEEDGCSSGVDFTVTGPQQGFYPVGSHDLQYVATYTASDGTVKTKICSFNVKVSALDLQITNATDVSCTSNNDGSITAFASGINGSGTPPFSYSLDGRNFQQDGTFAGLGAGTYNVTAKDATGCTTTSEDIILGVADEEAPTITAPADFTAEGCDVSAVSGFTYSEVPVTITEQEFINAGGTVSDNNSVESITYADSSAGSYPTVVTRTFTAVDPCGNSSTAVQTININDTTAPLTPTLTDVTVGQCEGTPVAPTTTDSCAGIITGTTSTTFPLTTQGNHVITWTFDDGHGNSVTADQNVYVTDNTAPVADAASLPDVTAQCEVTQLTAPTATDNCSEVTVTNDATLPITKQGTTVVTWTFEDAQGNTSTQTQNVVITDTTAPVADAASLPDVTAQCEVTQLTAPTATDNCSAVTVTHNAALPITKQGTTVVTWTYEDAQGNISTQTQNIVITDNTAPVADAASLPDVTAQCEVTQLTAPTATDNCSEVTVNNDAILPITKQGTTVVTWTFEDAQGNTSAQTQNVVITDTTAPVADAASLPDVTAQCEVTTLTPPTATDNCSAVTVSHNAALPIIKQGTTVVTWTYEDAQGNTSTQTQNIVITDNTAPVADAASLPDVTAQCEVTQLTAPTATDNCSEVTVTNDAIFPINKQGTTVVTWTYEDAQGNTSTQTQNIIIDDTTAPEGIVLAVVTGECSATVVAPTTSDNCAGTITATTTDPLTYNEQGTHIVTWTFDDGNGNTTTVEQNVIVKDTTAPEAVTLETITGNCEVTVTAPTTTDNCAGTITATTNDPLVYTELGTYQINWTFDDGNGNITNATQQVVVQNNTAPVAPVLADAVAECEITVPVPSTTNACTGETIEGTTSDPLTYTEQGSYVITWTFDDGDGNIVTSTQNVIIDDNTAPKAVVLADVSGECSATVVAPTTSDNCAGTITATTEDPLTYNEQGEYIVTWTFDDGNGNSTTIEQNVIVKDTTAPEAITLADVTGECSATVTAPTTSDNCAGTITATTEDPLTYNEQGEYVVSWTFDDGNGNTTTVDQNVIVKDTTAPEAITLADVTGECSATVTAPTTSDNCSGTITATTEDALIYNEQGKYTITWTFDDGNGNTTSVEQNVIVEDTTAPEAITLADVTAECSATVVAPTTSDNCAGTITATTTDPLTYNKQGTYVVNWTFNDGNGNITTVEQNVIVKDTTAPEAVSLQTITGNCEVTVTAPTTTDNCAGTITATTNDPLVYSELGTYQITWTFDDGNGNTSTATQQVVVENNTAPVAPVLADAVAECEITVPVPSTTNACTGETIEGTTNDPLTYTEQGSYVITWTFDDGDGNIVTTIQNVIIEDTTAPETIVLADVTGECSATVVAPTTADNCAGTITATTEDLLTYNEQGTYVVTWTFDDGNGNTTTVEQNVIVKDTTAPEAITLADVTGECSATVAAPTTTDNCSGTITATTEDPLTYNEQGAYVVTWTFDDGNGNKTTVDQNVIVKDVTAPEAVTLAEVKGNCEVTLSTPTAEDNCSGTITGTTTDPVTYSELGTYQITWTFDDGNGNTSTATQQVIVENNTAPVAPVLEDAVAECEITVPVPSTTNACTGETIEGTTNDPLTYTEQGSYVITWTFDDGDGNIVTSTQNVIIDDNTAPEAAVLADVTGECSATVVAPTTSDNCAGTITATTEDPLTYNEQGTYVVTWTFDDGNGNTTTVEQNVIVKDTTAPEAITLADVSGECSATVVAPTTSDNCSGSITATTTDPLTYNEQGTYVVTWTFDDGNGNTTTVDQTVIVKDTTAPEAITLADVTGECSATVTAPTTSDNCAGTITATTEDPLTYNEQGEYVVIWTFDDGNGNITTVDQNVIVKDVTAPEVIVLADVTGECSATVVAPTTSDNCAGTITATTTDPLTYNEQGTYVVTWTFDDGNGNTTTVEQNVIVEDVTAPEAVVLSDVTGECSATVVAPTTSDNCAGTITATTEDPLTYDEQGSYVVTWTFNDGNGNTTTVDQKVIVEDTTAPVWTSALPGDVTVSCGEVPAAAQMTAEDNCSATVEFSEETTTSDCASEYILTRTWTATDKNSNAVSYTQVITVEDTTAPSVVEDFEEVINIACEEIPMAPELTFQDNCSGEVSSEFTETMEDMEDGSLVITRTWTVSDCAGNEAVYVQTVNVDPTLPVIETIPADRCIEDIPFALSDLLVGDYDTSGTWEDPANTGALENGIIDPALLAVGNYTFNYVITKGECSSTTPVQVSINDDCVVLACELSDIKNSISKAVTPNGDNINDTFDITAGADCGFTYSVKIFNRWGNEVFRSNNYQPGSNSGNWDGTSRTSVTGSQLPAGTYFYIVEIKQSSFEPIQGYIYLGTK